MEAEAVVRLGAQELIQLADQMEQVEEPVVQFGAQEPIQVANQIVEEAAMLLLGAQEN